MKKYRQLFRMFLARYLTYRARIFIWIFTDSSQFILFPFLWAAIFANGNIPEGYTLKSLVTYYVILAVVSAGFLSHCARHIHGEIIDGMMSRRLVMPLPYYWFIGMAEISYKQISTVIAGTSIIILYIFARDFLLFPANALQWLMFISGIIITFTVSHIFQYIIGLSVFWWHDNYALQTAEDVVAAVFSGRLAPLIFFAPTIQQIADYMPFQYLAYVPAQIFIGAINPNQWWQVFAPAIAWIAGLSAIVFIMWRHGLRRHEGFGM